jgi:hypothetical protein
MSNRITETNGLSRLSHGGGVFSVGLLLGLMALASLVGGCDHAWQVYEQIELGRPLPQDTPLTLVQADPENAKGDVEDEEFDSSVIWVSGNPEIPGTRLHTWHDWGIWPLPWSVGGHAVSALVDANGIVIGRYYAANVLSNYAVVKVPASRTVVSVSVPEGLLSNSGGDRPDDTGEFDPNTLRGYLVIVQRQLRHSPPTPPGCLKLAGLAAAGGGLVMGYSIGGAGYHLENAVEEISLKGISETGYDRTFRPVVGGTLRLQNLGDGRIRIETNLLRVYDPLDLAAILYRN